MNKLPLKMVGVLLIISVLFVIGCKASKEIVVSPSTTTASLEEEEASGELDDLNELDTLNNDLDADITLDELEVVE